MDSWARLSLYESTDLVRGLFQTRHGRQLNAGKAAEIVSAIAQGKEYFSAAADSGLLVRPLLQYYGVLSLCRGLILLLRGSARETSLPKSHGLTPSGWTSHLKTDAPGGLGDLKVAFTKGNFPSVLESTRGRAPDRRLRRVLGGSNRPVGVDGAGLLLVNADGSGLTNVPDVTQVICPDWRPK